MTPFAECRCCGVCCFSALEAYVRVTGADWARLGDDAARWAHFLGHRAYMKMRDGHCAALELRPSPKGGVDFFCSVYEHRPQICRDLGRGSAQCAGELAAKAERVAAWTDRNNSAPVASCTADPLGVPVACASESQPNREHGVPH